MRAYEILPETWWQDLPANSLTVMGYNSDDEDLESDPHSLEDEIKDLRRQGKGL